MPIATAINAVKKASEQGIKMAEPEKFLSAPSNVPVCLDTLQAVSTYLMKTLTTGEPSTMVKTAVSGESRGRMAFEFSVSSFEISDEKADAITRLCEQHELVQVLEEDFEDTGLVVALAMAIEANWRVEFISTDQSAHFKVILGGDDASAPGSQKQKVFFASKVASADGDNVFEGSKLLH